MQTRPGMFWPHPAPLWSTIGLVLAAAYLSACGPYGRGQPTLPAQAIPKATMVDASETAERSAGHPKLDSSLKELLAVYQKEGAAGAASFAQTRGLSVEGERVEVMIVTTAEAVEGLTKAVAEQGGKVQGHHEGLIDALVPMQALASLADRPDVQRIREPQRAVVP